jgi:CHRD domain-containing protein
MKALSLAGAAFLVVFAIALGGRTDSAEAAIITVDVTAVGAQENPPVSGPGYAIARFMYNTDTKRLDYVVTVNGLSESFITASHIHRGAAGTNGPIVHNLSLVPFTQISGSVTLSDADVRDLEAGNLYVNVHSTTNPGGFARGQIILPRGAAPAASPAPSQPTVRPPSTGDGGLIDSGTMAPVLFIALVGVLGAGSLVAVRRSS